MSSDARISLVGNLGADPELRYTPNGTAVASFNVACSERTKKADGTWGDTDPTWVPVTVWGESAEHAAESLHKGDRVAVTGTMRQNRWEKDGQQHSRLEVNADTVGPDLRWATATLTKAGGGGGGRGEQPPPPDDDSVPF